MMVDLGEQYIVGTAALRGTPYVADEDAIAIVDDHPREGRAVSFGVAGCGHIIDRQR